MTEAGQFDQIRGTIIYHQYILKADLICFGEKGEHAVSSELMHINGMEFSRLLAPVDYPFRTGQKP